jgi:hypothetical protein
MNKCNCGTLYTGPRCPACLPPHPGEAVEFEGRIWGYSGPEFGFWTPLSKEGHSRLRRRVEDRLRKDLSAVFECARLLRVHWSDLE